MGSEVEPRDYGGVKGEEVRDRPEPHDDSAVVVERRREKRHSADPLSAKRVGEFDGDRIFSFIL